MMINHMKVEIDYSSGVFCCELVSCGAVQEVNTGLRLITKERLS